MTGYVRQSVADIVPAAIVRAAPINNELNALRDAFGQAAGHKHDGTAAEGHYVPLIADSDANNKVAIDTANNRAGVFVEVGGVAVEQVRVQDGAIVPVTDNDIDLGTGSLEFKDLYIDGTANIDSLIADTADINAGTIDNTIIGATTAAAATVTSLTSTGTTTLNGTTIPASKTLVVTTDKLSALAATTSSELAGVISDETGSGALVFANSPTLITPALGTPASGVVTNLTGTASININGTVGATTPSTGAFTTLSSTGNTTLGDASADTVTINGTVQPGVVISGSSTGDALRITQTGTGNALLVEDSTNPDSTPFVIDASGRVIQGYTATILTADDYGGSNRTAWGYQGNSANTAGALFTTWNTTATSGAGISLSRSRSATVGTQAIVSSGDSLGGIGFNGDDGTNFITAASISAEVDGTPGTNDMPGRLSFSTTADGASTPTERVRISSTGQTKFSYNAVVEVTDNTNAALRVTQLGTGNALLVEDSTNPDATPFVIDATGNVVRGNATPLNTPGLLSATALTPALQSHGTSSSGSAVAAFGWSATGSVSPQYILSKSRGASAGTFGVVASGDNLGGLTFNGDDGTAFIRAANIVAQVDGTPGTNDMPGRLLLSTTPDGSDTPVERIRITSAGKTGFATSAPAATVHVAGDTILSNVNVLGATYDSVSFSVAGQELTAHSVFFSPDGLKMYVSGTTGDDVNEYNLTTAWVVSSAVYSTTFSVSSQDTAPQGLYFRADGLKMYVVGAANDSVFQYTLSTPWSVATASYDSISFSFTGQETTVTGLFFKPNGLSMYIVGQTNDTIYQYTLSTAWDVSTATLLQSFSISGQEATPADLSFTGDGSRMFVLGTTGDDVNVYNLTTPWDISTAAFVNVFSVSGQDTSPVGIYIKPDGTKMYMVGSTNDTVYQYTIPSIDIQLTGQTSAAALDVQQDLTVYGNTTGSFRNNSFKENIGGQYYNLVSQADIGTAANEIPLNQYLGDMAYQDAANIAGPVGVGGAVSVGGGLTVQGVTVGLGASAIADNTGFGNNVLAAITTGSFNTAVGWHSSQSMVQGYDNVAVGGSSLRDTLNGYSNTAVGAQAMQLNTQGFANTAIGNTALLNNLTGYGNVAVGYSALSSSTGNNNVGVGASALGDTTGSTNTAIGNGAGQMISTGSNNVVIGGYTGSAAPISTTGSNWIVLSDGAGNVRQSFDPSGNSQMGSGAAVVYCPTPTTITGTATLTNADIQAQIINTTGAALYTVTLPLGTTLETLIPWSSVDLGYDFYVINSVPANITIGTNTGVTLVGRNLVGTNISAQFRIRRTAANTFIVYRIS